MSEHDGHGQDGHDCARDCLGIPVTPPASTFPSAPRSVKAIAGAVDFHVHSGPDVFGRALDDDETVALFDRVEFGAIVLKNHVAETSSRAQLARKRARNLDVYGGVVLNRAVGGLNPDAVRAMAGVEGGRGRVVWLPTIDAQNHVKTFGGDGARAIATVVDGKPTDALVDVVRACSDLDLCLHSGHCSADEAIVVAEVAQRYGVRFCVTHALFNVVGFDVPKMRMAASVGATFELCSLGLLLGEHAQIPWMRAWRRVTAETCLEAVRALGPQHFILSTDLGQSGNPTPLDGYLDLYSQLRDAGLDARDLELMSRRNPYHLLGVEPR